MSFKHIIYTINNDWLFQVYNIDININIVINYTID